MVSLVAVSALATAPALGQTVAAPGRDSFWLGLGGGGGSEGIAANMNASYQFGGSVMSLRTAATSGLYEDGLWDYALLYGRGTRPSESRYHAGAAVGVALVDGCTGGSVFSSCRDISAVVGLPIEVQAFWRPGSLVGLGLYGFANFNGARSFAGLTLGLQLGRLR